MTHPISRTLAWAAAAALLTAGGVLATVHAQAPSPALVNAGPSWIPIGVSASGEASVAWFHEPGARAAAVCRASAGAGGAPTVQCSTVKLP